MTPDRVHVVRWVGVTHPADWFQSKNWSLSLAGISSKEVIP